MKIKRIVIITLAVSLLLAGSVAMAGFDEDGNFVNQYQGALEEKVAAGELTQAEADSFSKVYAAVCSEDGEMMQRLGKQGNGGLNQFMDSEAMVEYTASMQVKLDEVFAALVTSGTLTQEEVDSINTFERGRGLKIEESIADLTDEQCDAIEAAMAEVHEYMGTLKTELAEAGLIGANPRMTLDGSNKGGGARGSRNN